MNRQEKTIVVALVADLVLVGIKYWLAFASGSLSLRASAWHSMGDVFVSVLVLVGLFAVRWESRARHQVGAVENIVSLVVSGFIFYIAYDIFQDVVAGSALPDLRYLWPVAIASFVTIIITYFIARYKEYVGRATNSTSLIASAYHSRMDLYASVLVVVSLIAAALGLQAVDRLAAIIVIVLIVAAGWEIVTSALEGLRKGGMISTDHIARLHKHSQSAARLVMGVLLVFTLLSGVYTVSAGEQGVVRRFGKVVGKAEAGLRYRIPFLDRVDLVKIGEIQQIQADTSLLLTGDTNLVQARLGVHYTISDPEAYLFNSSNTKGLLTKASETSFRQAVAARGVDELLTDGRNSILSETRNQTQALLDSQKAGLSVQNIQLISVTPPAEVADAFRDVASAREDKNTFINEALGYQSEVIPFASGEAQKMIEEAKAEKQRKVDVARGESQRFVNKLAAYRSAPAVTRTRLYLETLEQVLPKISKKYVIDPRVETDSTELWLSRGSNADNPN